MEVLKPPFFIPATVWVVTWHPRPSHFPYAPQAQFFLLGKHHVLKIPFLKQKNPSIFFFKKLGFIQPWSQWWQPKTPTKPKCKLTPSACIVRCDASCNMLLLFVWYSVYGGNCYTRRPLCVAKMEEVVDRLEVKNFLFKSKWGEEENKCNETWASMDPALQGLTPGHHLIWGWDIWTKCGQTTCGLQGLKAGSRLVKCHCNIFLVNKQESDNRQLAGSDIFHSLVIFYCVLSLPRT